MGAIIGGIVAGLVLSVWMLIGEVTSGLPSQLIAMERQIAGSLGFSVPPALHTASVFEDTWETSATCCSPPLQVWLTLWCGGAIDRSS